jgi:hypothetical protein
MVKLAPPLFPKGVKYPPPRNKPGTHSLSNLSKRGLYRSRLRLSNSECKKKF